MILAAVLFSLIGASALSVPSAAQVRQARSLPCAPGGVTEPTLRPRDEGPRRPDFVEFRRRLRDAVARRDVEGVLAALDPNVKVAFDGAGGIEAFKKYHLENPQQDFWEEFGTILALGGRFSRADQFAAPYVFAAWPAEFDSFECLAVIGTGVRLRAAPRLDARAKALLDYAIVQSLGSEPTVTGWRRVRLADGRTGYVASRYVRSPIEHRAIFEFKERRWWLTAYVAGD
ncbi:MAG TPA: SH3 domain-containing protein [Vicinamibacterales bacterium]|nr:SH3 domain-containing protein [Vicinamibacterales bacterium]